MRTAIGIGGAASGRRRDWQDLITYATEAESLGVDFAWSAEAWGMDAVAPLAFLAARTSRIRLGTGIMQISARVPAMTAMTALTMAAISSDRFVLGLGASGPQVVEGLHGVSFARPVSRMRETIEIVRKAFAGETLAYQGEHFVLPRPGGEGKALRLSQPANPEIPIYLATLSPHSLELTGELADGWIGTSFTPENAGSFFEHIATGARRAGRSLADLDLQVGGTVAFGGEVDRAIETRKQGLAFTLGAMGSARHNFYNAAFRRGGFAEVAVESQRLWLAGPARAGRASHPRRDGGPDQPDRQRRDGARADPGLRGRRGDHPDAASRGPDPERSARYAGPCGRPGARRDRGARRRARWTRRFEEARDVSAFEEGAGSRKQQRAPLSRRDQNRIEQRERILDHAKKLFALHGFDEVTVADIAEAAGVARATVFNNFASKHALVDAITQDVLSYYASMLDRALEDSQTAVPTLLRALADHMGEGIEQLRPFYKGVFREIAKRQVGLEEGGGAATARELIVDRIARLMERGQRRREISGDHRPEDLACAYDSLCHGTLIQWLYDDPSKSLRERMGRAVEIFLGPIANGRGAARSEEPLPELGDRLLLR